MAKNITYIPSKAEALKTEERSITRVAAYARVSSLPQEESYEAQVEHFNSLIDKHPNWSLVKVYGDEGITGLNTKKRTGFKKLIADGKKHRYDLLLVKSISRMGRNTVDLLTAIRLLKASDVGVFFEKENINTLEASGEMLLTLLSAFAQSESESISANVRLGLKYRMARGEHSLAYSRFLGYDLGKDGRLIINEEQAKTVRFIYDNFLDGISLYDLGRILSERGYLTGTGSHSWSKTSIKRILSNPKYCGDALLQCTVTEDIINRRRTLNHGQSPQYYIVDDHEPIVSRDTYLLALGELKRRAHMHQGLPVFGPTIRDKHGSKALVIKCPACGNSYCITSSRGVHYMKCKSRITGNCNAPIFKASFINEIVLSAVQSIWDMKPTLMHYEVPALTLDTPKDALEEAAGMHIYNRMSLRVQAMLDGDRPNTYDSSMLSELIDYITYNEMSWTVKFFGDVIINV